MPTYQPACNPNNSKPIIIEAITQCVAPANTATKPIAAKTASGNGTNTIKALPKLAPIKNKGVTSPPLNPAFKVNVVNTNFIKKS